MVFNAEKNYERDKLHYYKVEFKTKNDNMMFN